MDWWWLAIAAAATAIGVAAFLRFRKRRLVRALGGLRETKSDLEKIHDALRPHGTADDYIPEVLRRPLETEVIHIAEQILPTLSGSYAV